MIILPQYEPKVLHRKPLHEWREPSQRSTLRGIESRVWFQLTARASDGLRFWRGWFEDWNDADAFLWALTLHQQAGTPIPPEIRRLPQSSNYPHTFIEQAWRPALYEGEWRPEWSDLPLIYEKLAVTTFMTSPTGSNQTWTSPSDWDNATNTIEGLGGGGSGAARQGAGGGATGGGGTAYTKIVGFTVASPGTTTATYRLGAGGTAPTDTNNGNIGGDTYFNDTVLPSPAVTDNTKLGSAGGGPGNAADGTPNGGSGAPTSVCSGSTRFAGGRGGNKTSSSGQTGTGGGGAGGTTAAGSQGVDGTGNLSTNGGAGGTANGGTAGASGGGAGGGGTVWDASHGAGGGGGGNRSGVAAVDGGDGGLYGAGGGGGQGGGTPTHGGVGAQGILVVIYTPLITTPRRMFQYRQRRV